MPRFVSGASHRTGQGLALLLATLLMAQFAHPVQAGPLRTQLDLVKDSIYYDADTKAAHRWHSLEQYMVNAYKLASKSPQFNFEARTICTGFLPKHQMRLDALDAWVKAGEIPVPSKLVPKLTPFEGAANTAESVDLAYNYELELIGVLVELEATVTDPALRQQMESSRFESAHMAVRFAEWLQYDPAPIVAETLAEEKKALAATTP